MLRFRGAPHQGWRPSWALLVVATILLGVQLARADEQPATGGASSDSPENAARGQIALGLAKYEAGEYRAAAELFLDVYRVVPDANLLYNAARCYERLGENRKAIVRYQQFIEAPDSEQGAKARANAALQRLEQAEFLAMRKGPTDHAAAPVVVDAANRDAALDRQSGFPWYLLGVGTVAVGAGTWSMVSGWERQRQVTSDPAFDDRSQVHALSYRESVSLLESGERRMTWGAVGLGAGGALIATAVVWLLLDTDPEPEPRPSQVHLDVQAGSDQGRLIVGGWF